MRKLFGSSRNARTGQPHFTYNEINEAELDKETMMQNILKLREFKIYVESLNDFLLGEKLGIMLILCYSGQKAQGGCVCRQSQQWVLQ